MSLHRSHPFRAQVLTEQCDVAARTASGAWPAMAPAAWRVCMRQTFTLAARATVAAELAVAGAEARRSMRLFLVDNETSQARQRLSTLWLCLRCTTSLQGSQAEALVMQLHCESRPTS